MAALVYFATGDRLGAAKIPGLRPRLDGSGG